MHEKTELTNRYLIPRVFFAPKMTHGCMVGVKSEYLFSTLIANCGVIVIYNLSEPELIFMTKPGLALTTFEFQKGRGLKPCASMNVYTKNVRRRSKIQSASRAASKFHRLL